MYKENHMTNFSTLDNNRIHSRSELARFHVSFFKDAGLTQPVVPLDAGEYPAYAIYNPDNICVFKGVGEPFGGAGNYQVKYKIPDDAILSNDTKRWRIEWFMVSDDNRQFTYKQEFDVIDTAVTASDHRELKFITIAGKDFRAIFRLTFEPDFLQLDVSRGGFDATVMSATYSPATATTGPIKMVNDGDSKVFYCDIPGSLISIVGSEYNLLWSVRPTVTDTTQFAVNHLYTVNAYIMSLATSLRMLIDKFQKRLGTVQAYEDSDLVEYLQRGAELLNSSYPTTQYSIFSIPGPLRVFHILAAAMYGLNAQQLLEIDLGFSFSGQSVTLDYDHASQIDGVIGRWQTYISENLPAAKMGIVRATSPVGTFAGRMYRYNSINNYTYKVASQAGANANAGIIGQLNHLGLLF